MKLYLNIKSIPTILLFSSTIFYIKQFQIKPAYIMILSFLSLSLLNKKYILKLDYFLISILFIILLIYQLVFLQSDFGMILNATLSIFLIPILFWHTNKIKINTINSFLNICILFFLLEMLWRITNPVYIIENRDVIPEDGSGWFYPYKFSSFMFQDSNFVALHLFCLFSITLFLKERIKMLLFYILILLTFSRSVIISTTLIFIAYQITMLKYFKYIKLLFYPMFISLIIYLYYIYQSLASGELFSDGSFLTKFNIINNAINYSINNFTIHDYVFGIGLGNSYDFINMGAHNILVILFFETGILGFIIYLLHIITIYTSYISNPNKKYFILFYTFFILAGLSLGLYLFPIMVLTIGIISQTSKIIR